MPVFCVSYDLRKERKYDELYNKLESYKKWAHALESTWFIISDEDAAKVRDNLMASIDADDKLIVIEVISHWGSFNLSKEVADWLKNNI